jgi:inulin fructotransferase (DFA-I-forming)
VDGGGNFVSSNHVVAKDVRGASGSDAFSAQVEALLSTPASDGLPVTTVLIDAASTANTILDSGTDGQVIMDRGANAFRATPAVGSQSS